ncbi:hypothetical protein N5P37_007639 [Trichoderma harzianum]|nr:hypothetical protein N5P37_007639 [Trichoderma harzianum]
MQLRRLNAASLASSNFGPKTSISQYRPIANHFPQNRLEFGRSPKHTRQPNMSMFRAKKLDLGCFVKARTIRDHTKRKVFEEHEAERQALRYVIRNTTLPPRTRATAQLQLSQMHCYTRPTQIRNRCIMGGQGRGVLRAFKMTRFNFRMEAMAGNLPGVKRASW